MKPLTRSTPAAIVRFIAIPTAVVLVLCMPASAQAQGKKKKRNAGPALVLAETVKLMPRATGQTFVGTLEPTRRSVIGSAVEERIQQVMVEEGDYVDIAASESMSPLVKLQQDSADIAVAAAQVELELRKQALQELSATIPTEIDSAKAEVARLDSQLQFAKKLYDRTQSLASSMSRREMEETFSQYNSATQASNVAKAELRRLEATKEIRLSIAQQNIIRQQAELQRSLDLQKNHSVFAPFSGYVSRRMVEKGTWVSRGTPLIEIVQVNPIQLRIQVPQDYVAALQTSFDAATAEQPLLAEITVASADQPITGTVFRIIPDADSRTRSLPVIIRIENPTTNADGTGSHLLKPGLLARANLQFGVGEKVVMVPKDALVLNKGAASVYLIKPADNQSLVAKQLPVVPGTSNGNWIEVTGDLNAGDQIVVQGNERLRDGETVELLKE